MLSHIHTVASTHQRSCLTSWSNASVRILEVTFLSDWRLIFTEVVLGVFRPTTLRATVGTELYADTDIDFIALAFGIALRALHRQIVTQFEYTLTLLFKGDLRGDEILLKWEAHYVKSLC